MSAPSPAQAADPRAVGEGKYTRILDAAQALFWRYGVKRTSIDDVAAEAGVAKGTVYLYFDNKETLFFEVAERLYGEVWKGMNAALAADAPFLDRLAALLDAKIGEIKRMLAGTPHAAELMDETRAPFARTALDALTQGFREALDALVAEGAKAGDVVFRKGGVSAATFAEAALAAAYGAIQTGPLDAESYNARLKSHLALLIAAAR